MYNYTKNNYTGHLWEQNIHIKNLGGKIMKVSEAKSMTLEEFNELYSGVEAEDTKKSSSKG